MHDVFCARVFRGEINKYALDIYKKLIAYTSKDFMHPSTSDLHRSQNPSHCRCAVSAASRRHLCGGA